MKAAHHGAGVLIPAAAKYSLTFGPQFDPLGVSDTPICVPKTWGKEESLESEKADGSGVASTISKGQSHFLAVNFFAIADHCVVKKAKAASAKSGAADGFGCSTGFGFKSQADCDLSHQQYGSPMAELS